jgi:ubiquitin carboxyl-terminal hydrolase 5/13
VHAGHYVAHILTGEQGEWVFFKDDDKVVNADAESVAELRRLAYFYFFEKV